MDAPTIAELLKFADLQIAAEALYAFNTHRREPDSLSPGDPLSFVGHDSGPIDPAVLKTGNEHASRFAPTEAAKFAAQWTVKDHLSNTTTGFSGTLFLNASTDEYVLSLRSTEFIDDALRDSYGTNKLEIADHGWAFGQIADMEAWYGRLKETGLLPAGAHFSVTGYSLGGHLATAFNLLRREDGSIGQVDRVVTFNGAGVGKLKSGTLAEVVSSFRHLRDSPDAISARLGTTALRTAYGALHERLADGHRPTADDYRFLDGLPEKNVLRDALDHLQAMHDQADYMATVTDKVAGKAAQIPLTNVAQAGFDYQVAMVIASGMTEAMPKGSSLSNLAFQQKVQASPALPNQFDIVGRETTSKQKAMVADSQWHYGEDVPVFIEDQPLRRGSVLMDAAVSYWDSGALRPSSDYTRNDFGDTHSLVLIVDTLNVENALTTLNPGADDVVLNAILRGASALKADPDADQGRAEGDVLEQVVDGLARILAPGTPTLHDGKTREGISLLTGGTWADESLRTNFYEVLNAIRQGKPFDALKGKVTLALPDAGLADAARTDFAAFLTLLTASPVAIKAKPGQESAVAGILGPIWSGAGSASVFADWQADQTLTAAQRAAGQGTYSDLFLADRAALLSWKSQWNLANGRPAAATQVKAPWVFIDQTENTRYELSPNGSSFARFNQVVFGSDAGNGIAGDLLADRLYGMDGDDSLSGAAGADYLEGNAGGDSLDGGNGNDTLLGGADDDVLVGGRDADWLHGGKGLDRYRFTPGDGLDVIDDFDGNGLINIDGTVLAGGKPAGPNLWESPDKSVRYALVDQGDGTKTLNILYGGDRIQVLRFTDGMLGIHLRGADPLPPPPPRDRLVLGDFLPQTPPALDDLGNPVLTATPAPGRADALQDGIGNDSVSAGGGDDAVSALRGGDDRIDAGDGSDVVLAGAGADWVAGGEGPDVLGGGAGDDRLLALGEVDFSDAVAAGDTQAPSIGKGDFLDGGDASDTLVGDAGPDALLGGAGGDMISGGGGDDFLAGDGQAAGVGRTWSATRTVEGDRYTWTAVGFSVTGTGTGNDILAGGAGADWIFAGAGNDWADGGSDADVVFGEAGSDEIFGGAGNDVLSGDGPVAQLSAELHGNDFVEGGAGDDTLFGGQGSDNLFGRSGNDILVGDGGERTAAGGGMASGRGALGRGCGRVASSRISPSWVGRSSSTVLREKTHQRIPPFQCRKRHMDRRPGLRAMAVTRAAPDKANRVQRFLADGPFPALTGRWGTSRH